MKCIKNENFTWNLSSPSHSVGRGVITISHPESNAEFFLMLSWKHFQNVAVTEFNIHFNLWQLLSLVMFLENIVLSLEETLLQILQIASGTIYHSFPYAPLKSFL